MTIIKDKLVIMDASTAKIYIFARPLSNMDTQQTEDYITETLGFRLGDIQWQVGNIILPLEL